MMNSNRSPYYLRTPQVEKSTCFHNHIDAEDFTLLEKIVAEVEKKCVSAQNKLYPIECLAIGPQVTNPDFSGVYQSLPNFHEINYAPDEAFATGRMGPEGINYDQVRASLTECSKYPSRGVMTEIEEDIFAMSFDQNGHETIDQDEGLTPYKMELDKVEEWENFRVKVIPKFELHHGFDLPKSKGALESPIKLDILHKKCQERGFDLGAWFIFRKEKKWSYRCNEFSNDSYDVCLAKLINQARVLREIVKELSGDEFSAFESSCSLEKVHGIWKF